jgi:hypothetical protein
MARVDSPPSRLQVKKVFFDLTTFTYNDAQVFATLPANAVVVGHTIDCTTALVADSGSPNVTLKIGSTDILGARGFGAAPYDGTVIRPSVTTFKTTTETNVTVSVSSSYATAGQFNYFIEYIMSA